MEFVVLMCFYSYICFRSLNKSNKFGYLEVSRLL